MAGAVKVRVQRGIFDLDTFKEITLVKEIDFTPVESTQDALSRLNGNAEKFLSIINEGLRAETRRNEASNPANWRTFDEEGEINGDFEGTVADIKAVNALVLTLAKTVFGYSKEMDKEAKRKSKDSAMSMIQTTEAIKEGLKRSAALTPAEE